MENLRRMICDQYYYIAGQRSITIFRNFEALKELTFRDCDKYCKCLHRLEAGNFTEINLPERKGE